MRSWASVFFFLFNAKIACDVWIFSPVVVGLGDTYILGGAVVVRYAWLEYWVRDLIDTIAMRIQ